MKHLLIILAIAGMYGCTSHESSVSEASSDSVRTEPASSQSMVLMLTSRASQLAGVTTAVATEGTISDPVVLYGRTASDPGRSSVATSRFSGIVEKLYIREPGVSVRAGDPVAELFSPELTAQAAEYLRLVREPAGATLAEGARKRLLQQGIFDEDIRWWSAPPRLFTVHAATSGTVAQIEVREGSQVSPGSVLLRLEDTGRIRAEALIPTGSGIRLSEGQQVTVECAGQQIAGKVNRIDPVVEEGGTGVKAYIDLASGTQKLRVNLPVRVTVEEHRRTGLLIPSSSVFYKGDEAHVFIVDSKNTYRMKAVRTSPVRLGHVEVTSGLKAGDTVVTNGSYLLYSELTLRGGQSGTHESDVH